MSAQVLVVYASTHGHTARIAERLGAVLREQGIGVRLLTVEDAGADVDPSAFDGVIVGASVHAGHHQRRVVTWMSEHRAALNGRSSAFFSVSLTAADDTDEARETVQALIDDVLDASGWTPTVTTAFAGALQFHAYNVAERVLMRLIARRHGEHADGHADVDYTDWSAVERFGQRFAATVMAPSEVPS
jgi:menaquinone-dependent protoporphyrinogen oxidase